MQERWVKKAERNWQDLVLPAVLMAAGAVPAIAACLGAVSLDRMSDLWPAAMALVSVAQMVPAGGVRRS